MELETFKVEEAKSIFSQVDLNLERTKRIYRLLGDLSGNVMNSLKTGNLSEFSGSSDKMRPMLSYIADNQVLLSKHFSGEKNNIEDEEEISYLARDLRTNLASIEAARKALDQVDFNPVFFLSDDLTNAYLDYKIPMSWEFQNDLVVVLNLDNTRLLDALIRRGQKRIFVVGGSLNISEYEVNIQDVIVYKTDDHEQLEKLMTGFPQRPPRRFLVLDCGSKPTKTKKLNEISEGLLKGRSSAWLRFNTINRGDAVKVLDNLANIISYRQAAEFHNKFQGQSAVIVCPGPSLGKNKHLLKELKGKVLIICVLHALKTLRAEGIVPDIVIHTDPQNLKSLSFDKNGKKTTYWDHWMNKEDFEGVSYFVTSASGSPENFDIPVKEILWMSCGMRIGSFLPTDVHDYNRVGGSVSHSAFDLAIELGCKNIALVGQDLATTEKGDLYAKNAELDMTKARVEGLGSRFKAKGFYGKKVWTNTSFSFFATYYEYFANDVKKQKDISLFNCTEGGIFIKGFKHISLRKFIDKEVSASSEAIDEVFSKVARDKQKYEKDKEKIKRFIKENIKLSNEIMRLSKIAMEIAKKDYHSEDDLRRFDVVQNKAIKKYGKNSFYTLGLQKEIYILTAGVAADNTIKGQLGFHLDFLKAAGKFNRSFNEALTKQFSLMSSIS